MRTRTNSPLGEASATNRGVTEKYNKLLSTSASDKKNQSGQESFRDVKNISARLMMDAAPLACSLWEGDGGFIDCNQTLLKLFRFDTSEEFISSLEYLDPDYQPDGAKSAERLNKLKKHALKTGRACFKWTHRNTHGEEIPVEMTLIRVPWHNGDGLAVFERDLREIKTVEKRLRNVDKRKIEMEIKTRSAQAAYEEKSKFFASMSHKIKTPMNAIIGLSDLMRLDNLDQVQKSYFEDMKRISKQLLQMINDVLDFSKIEAGKLELSPVHFNLLEVFDHISSMSRFLAETKKLSFKYSFDPEVPHVVYGDDVRIRQVLLNIINNAIKYTKSGCVDFNVRKITENNVPYIIFCIKDTGVGIKKKDIPSLFCAYEQFNQSSNNDIAGVGLGLIISDKLVEMMGGRITVASQYGVGSEFTIWLPLKEGDSTLIEYSSLSEMYIATDDAKALVVDDNPINLKVTTAYLGSHNIKADTALNGMDAIKLLKKNNYDIVFIDHMMPDMDGIETVKRIRKLPGGRFKTLPVIALTANTASGLRNIFYEAGMSEYMAKPIEPAVLNKVVERWLPREKIGGLRVEDNKKGKNAGNDILDTATGMKNAADDRELYEQLVINFIELHADDKELIQGAIKDGEIQVACRLAHTLKSNAALLGAERLRKVSFELESEFRNNNTNNACELLDTLGTEMAEALKALYDVAPEKTDERIASKRNLGIGHYSDSTMDTGNNGESMGIVSEKSCSPSDGNVCEITKSDNTGKHELEHSTPDPSVRDFISRLKILLTEGNTESLELLDDIRQYLGPLGEESVELVAYIWDFEFDRALSVLTTLERSLDRYDNT